MTVGVMKRKQTAQSDRINQILILWMLMTVRTILNCCPSTQSATESKSADYGNTRYGHTQNSVTIRIDKTSMQPTIKTTIITDRAKEHVSILLITLIQ